MSHYDELSWAMRHQESDSFKRLCGPRKDGMVSNTRFNHRKHECHHTSTIKDLLEEAEEVEEAKTDKPAPVFGIVPMETKEWEEEVFGKDLTERMRKNRAALEALLKGEDPA
jgi:hypothetical protein